MPRSSTPCWDLPTVNKLAEHVLTSDHFAMQSPSKLTADPDKVNHRSGQSDLAHLGGLETMRNQLPEDD